MLKQSILFVFLWAFTGCASNTPDITGNWIQPVPGLPNQIQGISLQQNQKAVSINMQTLKYTSWERCQNTLLLRGESIGNHQTVSFVQPYTIEKLTRDTLILKDRNTTLIYHKEVTSP